MSYDSVLGEVEWKAEITFDDGAGGNIDYFLTATLLLWNGTALTDCAKNSWYSSHVQVGSTSTLPTGMSPNPNPLDVLDSWPVPPSSADLFVRMQMNVHASTSSDETDGTMTCRMMRLN